MRALLPLMLISSLLAGCGMLPVDPSESRYIRGMVRPLGDHFLYQACHQQRWEPLAAFPAIVAQEYSRQRVGTVGLPLYIESWGQVTERGLALSDPRVIGGGLNGCETTLSGARLQARGSSPNWVAQLQEGQIRYSNQAELKTQLFKSPNPLREGHLWRWRAETVMTARRTSRLELEIDPVPCRDGSGHWYKLSAIVRVDGAELSGCARYGDLAPIGLAQRYVSDGERYLRQLSVELQADGQAQLRDDYRNGQPAFVREGRWEILGDGRLMLALRRKTGHGEEPLLWQVRNDGSLRLQTRHPSYGANIELQPTGESLQWSDAYRAGLP